MMKLLFAGDVMLGRLVNEMLQRQPPAYPWGDTLALFMDADLNICNLECAISDRGEPLPDPHKPFHFRSDAKNIEVLKRGGIDIVSLANNHALDYGYDALEDTIKLLSQSGIGFAGAGSDLDAAAAPYIMEAGEQRVGFISFTDNEPPWAAGAERAGIFHVPIDPHDGRAEVLFDLVRETSELVDLLIVAAHWGPNWGYHPPFEQPPFARALVDAGADIIFGHSSHVFRGIEIYLGKPIIYSTGNFIDDYAINELERNDESFIFVVEHDEEGCSRLLLYPTVIGEFRSMLAKGSRQAKISGKMTELCAEMGTRSRWLPDREALQILPRRSDAATG